MIEYSPDVEAIIEKDMAALAKPDFITGVRLHATVVEGPQTVGITYDRATGRMGYEHLSYVCAEYTKRIYTLRPDGDFGLPGDLILEEAVRRNNEQYQPRKAERADGTAGKTVKKAKKKARKKAKRKGK